jgi:predicted ArsR family transcriptional regulator
MTELNPEEHLAQLPGDEASKAELQLLGKDLEDIEALELPLERTAFTTRLLTDLVGSLQAAVGESETTAFVDAVGLRTGEAILSMYRNGLRQPKLSLEAVATVLVDLKRRIDGDFHVISISDERIVLRNHACPFGSLVRGRPSLCAMTSNVFGTIVAENNGYARVELSETIANGSPGCHVVVHLQADSSVEVDGIRNREYFGLDV